MVAGYLERITAKSPSTIKYYTMGEAVSSTSGFFMIHQLGGQVIPKSLDMPAVDEAADNDGNLEED